MLRLLAFTLLLVGQSARLAAQDVPASAAASTRLLPISGVLTDAAGTAVSGAATVTFTLYEAQEGGTPLWTEIQQLQADARGRYAAYLGAVAALPLSAFSQEQARWIGVEVNGVTLPRVMLVAVPYALRAADAETLGGKPLSSFVLTGPDGRLQTAQGSAVAEAAVDGSGIAGQIAKFSGATSLSSSIITETGANRLGIGTTDPSEGGLIDSKVTIRAADGGTALAISNQVGTPRFALNINADGSWIAYDRSTGAFLPGIAQRGGRVGVSTTDPTGGGVVDSKLTIRNVDNNTGIAVLNQSDARRYALNTLSSGGWTLYDGANSTWNAGLSQIAGSLGVGTATPSGRISVVQSGSARGIDVTHSGTGAGVFSSTVSGFALWGIASSISSAGVVGDNLTGEAVVGRSSGGNGVGAVVGRNDSDGYGTRGFNTAGGIGVLGQAGISGGTGRGGRFENVNSANTSNALEAATNGTGSALLANNTGAAGNIAVFQSASANVARIDKTGKGFFNGGTQASGADLAESFSVEGDVASYEPGDVMEISTATDRRLRKTDTAYSSRVVGVYATKPGVLLSDLSIEADHGDRIPLGVVGVIPTKVTSENGEIQRGDLLVASGTPGHAMKAGPQAPTGSVIGKALAGFAGPGAGVIEVLVNVR